MRIKRIEIIGFKSFCDRTVVSIDQAITAVVGPNGCGKSNIVDAVRWCMGEQSAKHLRGKAMDDVIFAGSESRGPASMAEVSLTFDDVGFSQETLDLALGQDPAAAPAGAGAQAEAPAEAAATNEAATDEAATDEAATDEAATDEAATEAVATAEAATDEAPTAEAATEQVATEAVATAEAATEDAATTEAAPAEGAAGEAATTEAATEDAATEDAASGEDATGEAAAREAAAQDGGAAAAAADEAQPVGASAEQPGAPQDTVPSASSEVSTFLEDKPAAIDFSQFTEVTITRRLFRDGTSSYLINKTPCRLRDVTDFFLGTGVGTKAYSIIEQGRIGMIVSARPQDRRAIVEEAAGITKFKTKKRAAERKLEQTRQNLLRVSDIVSELGKRMGSLKRQAQKAERYRRYKSEVKDIEMWKASHRLLAMRAEERVLGARLAETSETLKTTRAQFETQDAAVIAERSELAVEERRLSALQEVIYDLDNRIKLSESKVEFQRREASELEERVAGARGEIKTLDARKQEGAEELQRQRAELETLTGEAEREETDVEARDAATDEARRTLAEAQARLDEARRTLEAARSDLVRAESRTESLQRRRQEAAARLERVTEDTGVANARVKELDKEARASHGKLADLKQTRLDLGQQTETLEARKELLTEAVHTSEAQVETLRTELQRRKSRLQSLIEIHAKYEGFARGTRAVMQKKGDLAAAPDHEIRGLVADVVNAPEQLEVAVEAALGDRLGGILVNSHELGVKAVRFLKEASAGRSSFVPYRQAAEVHADGSVTPGAQVAVPTGGIEVEDRTALTAASAAVGGEGVLGRMVDLVRFDAGYEKVGRALLGDCVVVDSLERAVELHRRGVGSALVTLDGDIVDERGVVTGGSRDAEGASVLAQKREIRDLEQITASMEQDLTDASARLVAEKGELKQITRTLERIRSESHEGDIAIMGLEKDVGQVRRELDRLRERLTQLNAEQLELEARLSDIDREGGEMGELHASATERIERVQGEEAGMHEAVATGRARLEELAQSLTAAKIRAAQLGEKRASVESKAVQLEVADRELRERIERLQASIDASGDRARTLREEAGALEDELGKLRAERSSKSEELEAGRSGYELRIAELQMAEMAVRELRTRAERLAGEVNQLELKLANLDGNRRVLVEGIADRYNLELDRHLGDYHLRPLAGKAEDERLAELKRLIDRMGADINLTAIEEYEEVSTRHEFLSTQQADLENAVSQLEKAISKINRTSRKLFRDTFNAINAKFQEVYPRLFRGGRARLSLTGDDDDVLEAGVEIMAQPPGKKNTTVDQLSGGEKALTAVALIFSIFLIKPSPFCVLDEVDAPLDDANVDRYNEIVREMTDRSQFIVITHNKRTMEIADQLYGVTMQEPGVSKLVTVNINKIAEQVAA